MPKHLVDDEKILEEVKEAIAQTTGVDKSGIEPESSLVSDLGLLSLDFLDVNFRLEQVFGIKMARNFVLEHAEELFGEGTVIDENSEITDKGVEILKLRLGDAANGLVPGTPIDELPALVTASTLTNAVRDILDRLPGKSPAGADWKTEDGTHIVCSKTGVPATFPSGDDLIREWLQSIQAEKQII